MDNSNFTNKIFKPSNISPNKYITAACHFHPNQQITNFDRSTLMPLCPNCIQSHLQNLQQNGQTQGIESIEQMQLETQDILANMITNMKEVLNKIQEFKENKSDSRNSLHDSIQHAKQKAQRVVDAFFDQISHDLHQVTDQGQTPIDQDLEQAENFMTQKLNELHNLEEKINGPKFLKCLVRIHGTQYIAETEKYQTECQDYIDEITSKSLDINVDDNKLYLLNVELAKFVQIKNAEFYKQEETKFQKMKADYNNPYIERSVIKNGDTKSRSNLKPSFGEETSFHQDIYKVRLGDNQSQSNQIIKNLSPSQSDISRSKISQTQRPVIQNLFIINTSDYFESGQTNKIIHCFVEGTRQLRIYPVDTIINPSKRPVWKDIELDINFLVPKQHSTVVTSQGQIYLIGGVLNQKILKTVWRLDLKTKSLQQLNEDLITPRYGHVSIFINGKIYIFGGIYQQDLQSCESFDTQYDNTMPNNLNQSKQYNKGSQQLANMKYGGRNQTVCSFRQIYVIKVSTQGTEIYDISKDIWQQIQINMQLLPDCGMVQINSSSILIFGGSSQRCPYGQLKIQGNQGQIQFAYEALQDTQNIGAKLEQISILPGTLVFQGKLYSVGLRQQNASIIVGMPDYWII